jgi:hypothetical protein
MLSRSRDSPCGLPSLGERIQWSEGLMDNVDPTASSIGVASMARAMDHQRMPIDAE